jgi:hypothetical protein
MKVITLARTPDATDTCEWTDAIKIHKNFIMIRHNPYRDLSRWSHVDRKRPFLVSIVKHNRTGWVEWSSHTTYELALKSAQTYANSLTTIHNWCGNPIDPINISNTGALL